MSDVIVPEALQEQNSPVDNQRLKNWAEDPRVVRRVKDELVPILIEARSRRKPLSDMWNRILKVWTLEHESSQYGGRSQVYVPAGKKGTETIITQLVSATFPSEDYFSVEAKDQKAASTALVVRDVLKQRIENDAKVRVHAERFYRQLGLTGNSPVKMHYRRDVIKGRDRKGPQNFVRYDAPVFESIDIANFYIWPENVNDPKDAELKFEDITVTYGSLCAKARKKIYSQDAVDKISKEDRSPDVVNATNEKLMAQGISAGAGAGNKNGWGMVDITEVWLDFDPTADCREEEENPVPFLITVSNSGHVLRAIENPFWHKRCPIVMGRMGTLVGRVYGTGWVEGIHQLNVLLNAQVNQAMDCGTYALNPIALVNPHMLMGPLTPIEPGVQWFVNSLNDAVKFDRPPVELIQAGSMLTTGTMSWINDFIGAPPVLSGGSTPGRAFRTATGVGTAQKNATLPLQEMVRLCEEEVWEEMLFHFWSLDQQFAEDPFMLPITTEDGQPGFNRVSPEMIAGNWMYSWKASSQTSNQAVRGQQITELMQVLAAPQMMQLLQSRGVQFNPVPLIRKLYQEVYGFRNVNEVIVAATLPGGGQPAGPGAPEVGGGSAEALNGSSPDLNETSNFGDMRGQANDISSAFGSMNMGGFDGSGEA